MGVCIQKSTIFKQTKTNKSNLRQSFLYSSFTYDPSYTDQSNFFFFDVPHYCEIQYILRKGHPQQEPSDLQTNIQKHIEEIQGALSRLNTQNFIPSSKLQQSVSFKKKSQKDLEAESKELKNQYVGTKKPNSHEQLNHTLNLQIFSVTLEECQNMEDLPFHISLNDKKITTILGNVSQNKWRPSSNNKFSFPGIKINLEDAKQQSNIKISAQLGDRQLECTIPCNKIVFKYIIPVLQTSNLRGKGDNEPLGHVHFKIEYVSDFETHKKNVIKDLLARKQGLEAILNRLRNKEESVGDKSLIIDQHEESFRSDPKQESKSVKKKHISDR